MKNKTQFSLCVFYCNVQETLLFLISLISTKQDLLPFQILLTKLRVEMAALSFVTPLVTAHTLVKVLHPR